MIVSLMSFTISPHAHSICTPVATRTRDWVIEVGEEHLERHVCACVCVCVCVCVCGHLNLYERTALLLCVQGSASAGSVPAPPQGTAVSTGRTVSATTASARTSTGRSVEVRVMLALHFNN